MLLNAADLIDGIQLGADAATSSPAPDASECSEDAETLMEPEPTVDDGPPASNLFDDNVPKYSDAQLDAVRKYGADCWSA